MPQKAARNAGWFVCGYDPRRHVLTTLERRRGGESWLRRHYLGGSYAVYLGQGSSQYALTVAELAQLAGDNDRPGP